MRVGMDKITAIVSAYCGLTVKDIKSSNRCRRIARPRQIAMYLCRENVNPRGLQNSFPEIGRHYGKDHTTALHAWRQIEMLQNEDADIALTVHTLRARFSAESSEFQPFKSAAQSAAVFISGGTSPTKTPDGLAGRATPASVPGRSFFPIRPVNGFRSNDTGGDFKPPSPPIPAGDQLRGVL
jgi:hypothetical protein